MSRRRIRRTCEEQIVYWRKRHGGISWDVGCPDRRQRCEVCRGRFTKSDVAWFVHFNRRRPVHPRCANAREREIDRVTGRVRK